MWDSLCILWLAIVLDATLGEPPTAMHPVAWMGRIIGVFFRLAPKTGVVKPFVAGMLFTVVGVACVAAIGWGLHRALQQLPSTVAIFAEAVLLKVTFSLRGLLRAGLEVRAALQANDLPEARRLVSWHLVSRDTAELSESQVVAATIESLAENASDSFVSPLLFYVVFGLPGALACRFINTCDAMLGYRDPQREWLGKFSARLDDVMHLVPARLTAITILLVGAVLNGNPVNAFAIWRRDCRRTASPNAGQPMSAAAGTLSVELEKVGCYRLGAGLRPPLANDITRAAWLIAGACLLAALALSACLMIANSRHAPATSTTTAT